MLPVSVSTQQNNVFHFLLKNQPVGCCGVVPVTIVLFGHPDPGIVFRGNEPRYFMQNTINKRIIQGIF